MCVCEFVCMCVCEFVCMCVCFIELLHSLYLLLLTFPILNLKIILL